MTQTRQKIEWTRCLPFILMHVACLSVIWVGWSWPAVATAFLMYVARAFGLTAFYHRYFSHRAFKTSRWFQFLGGALGSAAVQRDGDLSRVDIHVPLQSWVIFGNGV